MDIGRLNEFITLGTLLNYSTASSELYLSQPSLSRHISDLEKSLGTALFVRDTHNVQLTAEGKIFLKGAREILEKYNQTIKLIENSKKTAPSKLNVGFLGTATLDYFSTFIIEFTTNHPNIQLSLQSDTMDEMVRSITDNVLDLATVTFVDKNVLKYLKSKHITSSRMYAICHPHCKLANKKEIWMKELNDLPFISFSSQTQPILTNFNKTLFKTANVKCKIVREVKNIETSMLFLSANEGFFLAPKYLIHMFPEPLCKIPIKDKFAEISINLIWRKDNPNTSINTFVDSFNEFLKKHTTGHK